MEEAEVERLPRVPKGRERQDEQNGEGQVCREDGAGRSRSRTSPVGRGQPAEEPERERPERAPHEPRARVDGLPLQRKTGDRTRAQREVQRDGEHGRRRQPQQRSGSLADEQAQRPQRRAPSRPSSFASPPVTSRSILHETRAMVDPCRTGPRSRPRACGPWDGVPKWKTGSGGRHAAVDVDGNSDAPRHRAKPGTSAQRLRRDLRPRHACRGCPESWEICPPPARAGNDYANASERGRGAEVGAPS
jgi:hypothetical protein